MTGKIILENPLGVSEYISLLNEILAGVDVQVQGEVDGLKKAASGHVYFMLKDEKGDSVINCAIWKSVYNMCGLHIEEGMKLILSGSADVYPVRGTLTFKVRSLQLAGEGALKKAYMERKKRLSLEGVFDNCRPLPEYPCKIGLITSMRGAAVHDFVSNLGKFGFKVIALDSRVEGQEAVPELISAVRRMKKEKIDVLAIVRGGGSIQSLIAFDNEMLAREVSAFPVPVIAGIGHHEDVTLVALASDRSESTPTAAANLLGKGFERAKEKLGRVEMVIKEEFGVILEECKDKERLVSQNILLLERSTYSFKKEINRYKQSLDQSFLRLIKDVREENKEHFQGLHFSFLRSIGSVKNKMEQIEKVIFANNPERQLKLGYSIVYKGEKIQKSVDHLSEKDIINITFSDGDVGSEIKSIKKHASKK